MANKSTPVLPINEEADAAFEAWWREHQKHRTLTVKVTPGRWVSDTEVARLRKALEIVVRDYEAGLLCCEANGNTAEVVRICREALEGEPK